MVEEKDNSNSNIVTPQMPTLLEQTVMLMRTMHPNVSSKILTNIVLAKTAQMVTAKRVKYSLMGQALYPNHYAIVFMPSGYGKDLISNEIDNYILKNYRLWFSNEEEKYYQKKVNEITNKAEIEFPTDKQKKQRLKYIDEECRKIRRLPREVSKGTPEGLFADAYAFKKAGFGALLVKYGEFGLLLKNAKNEDDKVMQALFELYDGNLSAKSIKMDNNIYEVNDIPCNALLYSDPTLFAKDLKPMFNTLMQTGLGRRATISYMHEQKILIEKNPDIAYEKGKNFITEMDKIGEKLFSIFLRIKENSIYEVTEETYKKVFYPYKVKLNELANNEENPLIQTEINSRWFKALKISCLFAVINHVNELIITPEDMEQAINVVDMLGKDFKYFVRIKPVYKDVYDRVFEFFKENIGQEFTATQLKRTYYKEFGISRKTFDKEFEEIMKYVTEISAEKGYLFQTATIQPTGIKFSLHNTPSGNLSEGVLTLEQLIDVRD